MNRLKITGWCFLIASLIVLALNSCSKDDDEGTSTVNVVLTDAPGEFQQVNVQVTDVMVNGPGGWVSIPTNDSIYDLLLLQNNAFAILGTGPVPSAKLNQIRLILGTQNTVMVDSIVHPLLLSSQDETGLKLNVNQTLVPNTAYTLVIDFDASQSIVLEGNGSYRLKPTLKASFI